MHNTPDPIILGTRDEFDFNDDVVSPDQGAISDAVETVAQEQDYDGYQLLPQGTIFVQTIWGRNENQEQVYPVGAGVTLSYDYVQDRELMSPESFLILRTETLIDPSMVDPDDITVCPVADNQLGQWLWSYWTLEEDPRLVILDESYA